MATSNGRSVAGPVPFTDVCGARPEIVPPATGADDDAGATAPALDLMRALRWYQGTWLAVECVPGVIAIQQGSFLPPRGDVVLASAPKCGTTWVKTLAFATHPPGDAGHPLLRLNPHDCVPFMDLLFADGGSGSGKMDALPSPRLMATHMHHALLPASISKNPGCKIIYICRDPKDMLVSLWHFSRTICPDLAFSDIFEHACEGVSFSGPIWDHVLGYWNASKESPETVLFLRYEEVLLHPVDNVKKIARFVGLPFSPAEDIVRLCSFKKMKEAEANKGGTGCGVRFSNSSYFRRGEAGDWASHMTPEMARRLDAVMEEKLRGSGLCFA